MSDLKSSDVDRIEKLANLKLKSGEKEKLRKQLSQVLGHISILEEVDTDSTQETSQTTGLTNVLREDKIKIDHCLTQEEAVSPKGKDNNLFEVPRILKQNG